MAAEGISTNQIDSMLAMLRETAARAAPPSANPMSAVAPGAPTKSGESVSAVNFADLLKNTVNKVNQVQASAQQMSDRFAAGDSKTSLSDVMIEMQKANINLQITVQARNKLVGAYNEIMNMQI